MAAPARKPIEQMVSEVDTIYAPFSAAKVPVMEAIGVIDNMMWKAVAAHCRANGWEFWEYIDAASGLPPELRRGRRPNGWTNSCDDHHHADDPPATPRP